ncbi:unnamed protein product [Tenebrio molitor]|nr:unnamed protein product [Tenebrio molitor]
MEQKTYVFQTLIVLFKYRLGLKMFPLNNLALMNLNYTIIHIIRCKCKILN